MYKFIKKLIIFSLIPIFIIVGFDAWLRKQKLSYEAKYEGLIAAKNDVELLILGNSHATYGVDPSEFKSLYAYNIANVSQKIFSDKRIVLKAFSEHNFPKLKYVMISLDYHSLYTSSQGVRDNWSYYSLGIKYPNKSYLKANLSPFLWGYTPKVCLSFLKKRFLQNQKYLDMEKGIRNQAEFEKGFIPLILSNNKSFNREVYEKKVKGFIEPKKSEREEVLTDLKDFIVELQKRNIQPILFTSPTFKEYNTFLDQTILAENKKDIQMICSKFKIKYWDFMNDNRFEKESFYDADHLNDYGAIKFSKFLEEKINNFEHKKNY